MDAILRGVSNYTSITFKPSVDGQVIFEEIIDLSINDIEKTELYVNGIRYNIDEDYQIENKRLKWKGSFDLETSYNLVFISR